MNAHAKLRNLVPVDRRAYMIYPYKPSVFFVGYRQTVQNETRRHKTQTGVSFKFRILIIKNTTQQT